MAHLLFQEALWGTKSKVKVRARDVIGGWEGVQGSGKLGTLTSIAPI